MRSTRVKRVRATRGRTVRRACAPSIDRDGIPRRSSRPRGESPRARRDRVREPADAPPSLGWASAGSSGEPRAHDRVRRQLQAHASLRRQRHAPREARPHPASDGQAPRAHAGVGAHEGGGGARGAARGVRGVGATQRERIAQADAHPTRGGRARATRGRHQRPRRRD